MLKVVDGQAVSSDRAAAGGSLLDAIARDGARQMLVAALLAEVAAHVDACAGELDADGHRLVVRNGFAEPREVMTAAGAVGVRAPRVNDKRIDEVTGERCRFSSAILPAWSRKSPRVAEVLPLLYLHGLSSSDFAPALDQFLGSGAGLSATTITRLTTQWQQEATAFNDRSLADVDYVYCWVDGIHFKVRLTQDKVCLLVMIGVRADGSKELIALADGHRESTESWADLLRSCKRRGMRAPVLAVGDGALGFWSALRDVFPTTREQRCWFHASGNVLNALPKSAQPGARAALAEIYNAEDRGHAVAAARAFATDYGGKWPKATAKISGQLDVLLEFYNYPAEHWVHLRTTNPIESTFATVRLRQRVTKGPGSRAAGVAMAFKLLESAQTRWRAVNAPHLVALVRAGATFENGKLLERPADQEVISKSPDADPQVLTIPLDEMAMGESTEMHNAGYDLTREQQDEFSARSHELAAAAIKEGRFAEEIVPVAVPQRKGDPIMVTEDEGVRPGTTTESLGKLKPAFRNDGTITAGSASQISDGGCALVVMSAAKAKELGCEVLAEIGAHGVVAGPDASLQSQPAHALKKALAREKLQATDLKVVELNEAFAAVGIASTRELGIDPEIVNPNGGAIALGHPIGMSGARLVLTLAYELKRRGGGVGGAALCGGGGQGDALILHVPA